MNPLKIHGWEITFKIDKEGDEFSHIKAVSHCFQEHHKGERGADSQEGWRWEVAWWQSNGGEEPKVSNFSLLCIQDWCHWLIIQIYKQRLLLELRRGTNILDEKGPVFSVEWALIAYPCLIYLVDLVLWQWRHQIDTTRSPNSSTSFWQEKFQNTWGKFHQNYLLITTVQQPPNHNGSQTYIITCWWETHIYAEW